MVHKAGGGGKPDPYRYSATPAGLNALEVGFRRVWRGGGIGHVHAPVRVWDYKPQLGFGIMRRVNGLRNGLDDASRVRSVPHFCPYVARLGILRPCPIHSAMCHLFTPAVSRPYWPRRSGVLDPSPESLLPPKHSCPPCLFLSAAISPPSPIPLILLTPYHSAPIPLTGHHLGGAHQQTRSGESVTGRRRRRIEPRRQAGGHAASRCHGAGSRRRRRQRRWPAVWVDQSLMAPGEALAPAQGGASPPRFRSSGRHKRWGQALLGVGGPVQLPPSDDGAA